MRFFQKIRGLSGAQLLIVWLVLAIAAAPLASEVRRNARGVSDSQVGIDAWAESYSSALAAGDFRRAEFASETIEAAAAIGSHYYADRKRALYGMGALLVLGLSVTGVWLGRRNRVAFVKG